MNKKQKIWMIAGISVVVIIALVLVFASLRSQNSTAAAYQTTTVQRGTLTSTVEGTGTVASVLSANLTWLTSGQVDQVNALIGDQVSAGDILATLLTSSLPQNILLAPSNLVTAQRNLDTSQNSGVARAQAQVDLYTAQQAYTNAEATLNMLVAQSHGATTSDIQNLQAQITLAQNRLTQAENAYNGLSGLPDDDPQKAQAYSSLYSARQSLTNAVNNLNAVQGGPSTTNIQNAQANLELAQANLEAAQDKWERVQDGTDPNEVAAAEAQVIAAQQLVDQAYIIAPFDGTITQAEAVPNAIVSPSTQAFRIDDLSNLVIDVQVVEIDVNNVQVGQSASIVFDAIPNKTYTGTVIKSDLSGTVAQNSVTFTVTVQLADADEMVRPGMAANVTIVTNEVQDALLVPSTAIFLDDNDQQFVYVVRGGLLNTVPVTVGATSDTTTQVTSDSLQEGDTIVLSFTTTSTTSGFGFGGGMGGRVVEGGDQPQVTNP
jgi:HlyD family secretion protein